VNRLEPRWSTPLTCAIRRKMSGSRPCPLIYLKGAPNSGNAT
jgi:hypothetical protein